MDYSRGEEFNREYGCFLKELKHELEGDLASRGPINLNRVWNRASGPFTTDRYDRIVQYRRKRFMPLFGGSLEVLAKLQAFYDGEPTEDSLWVDLDTTESLVVKCARFTLKTGDYHFRIRVHN